MEDKMKTTTGIDEKTAYQPLDEMRKRASRIQEKCIER